MSEPDYVVGEADVARYRVTHQLGPHDRVSPEHCIAWLKANPSGGMKFDGGKPRWSLILGGCIKGLRGILAVLEFGAKKYAANSWQQVEPQRYVEALNRHLMDIQEHGIQHIDHDSGLLSIYHLGCDALFLAHFATAEAEHQAREATR